MKINSVTILLNLGFVTVKLITHYNNLNERFINPLLPEFFFS